MSEFVAITISLALVVMLVGGWTTFISIVWREFKNSGIGVEDIAFLSAIIVLMLILTAVTVPAIDMALREGF